MQRTAGRGKKLRRSEDAALGMAQPDQRLGAVDQLRFQIDLRLIPQLQPVAAQRLLELAAAILAAVQESNAANRASSSEIENGLRRNGSKVKP